MPFVSAIITAAGTSSRFGENKLKTEICGKECLAMTIESFETAALISEIIIVSGDTEYVRKLVLRYGFTKVRRIVPGSDCRQRSVMCGFSAVSAGCEYVAIHDGARPLILPEEIDEAVKAAFEKKAVCVCYPQKDSVKLVDNGKITGNPDRSMFYCAATPQIFSTDIYKKATDMFADDLERFTDDASIVCESGTDVYVFQGNPENIKLTTPEDGELARMIISKRAQNIKYQHLYRGKATIMKIAVQLYTLGRKVRDEGMEEVLKNVAAAGFDGVEFAGYAGIGADDMKALLDKYGLQAVGSHLGVENFEGDNFDSTIAYLKKVGAGYATVPGIGGYEDYDSCVKVAQRLNAAAEKMKGTGIKFSYHNHSHEFTTVYNGKTVHEIFREFAPELHYQLDTGWSFAAGVNNGEYMRLLGEKLDLIHIKDVNESKTPVEIGTGTVDEDDVFAAVKDLGIEWGVLEQDCMHKYENEYDSIKESIAFIKSKI